MSTQPENDSPVTKADLTQLVERLNNIEALIAAKDLTPITIGLENLRLSITSNESPREQVDLAPVVGGIEQVQRRIGVIEEKVGASITAEAFKQLEGKVVAISTNVDSIKNKKDRTPIIVGIIAGLFGLLSVWFQSNLQEKMQDALKQTEANLARSNKENEAFGTAVGMERANFYLQARGLLEKIDTAFAEVCYFPVPQPEPANISGPRERSKLTSSLDEYRKLLENALDGLDEQTKTQMKRYSEFVANGQFDIFTNNLNDDEKVKKYEESKRLLKDARDAIKNNSKQPAFTSTRVADSPPS